MRALTVEPGQAGSLSLEDVPEPSPESGSILADAIAIGVCGTDREIAAGQYGWPPPGRRRLILGHESLARVREAPADSAFRRGDLIAGIVRRPDPVPCRHCAAGEWDMCRNGRYTERGIKELDGYASERVRVEPEFAVKIDPALGIRGVLLEPASVLAKAWDHIDRIGLRTTAWRPRSVLVTGAGSIGLLGAMMGRQRGLEVHVYDRVTTGVKPALVRDLGGTYHGGDLNALRPLAPDIILECTGATPVIAEVVTRTAPAGVVCLAGVSPAGRTINLDLGDVNRRIVLENDALFGSVNANRSHYERAAASLAAANQEWLARLITRRIPIEEWPDALEARPDDVKVVLEFTS
jgi:threonine dehydrogenase-like Zn-dependent dehydrogenase